MFLFLSPVGRAVNFFAFGACAFAVLQLGFPSACGSGSV
jgi:hypothetical protein